MQTQIICNDERNEAIIHKMEHFIQWLWQSDNGIFRFPTNLTLFDAKPA